MSAANRVAPFQSWPDEPADAARGAAVGPQLISSMPRVPALRLAPLLRPEQPRRFVRVPTHAVGVHPEQREYPRASLNLPMRLRSAGGVSEEFPITLVTRNISSTGVYFLCPRQLTVGASIELEIVLVSKPLGLGNVVTNSLAPPSAYHSAESDHHSVSATLWSHVCKTEACP